MAGQAEERFRSLVTEQDVLALVGSPEDSYLDCKEWPSREDDLQKLLAKAVCAMANADGGSLVIGMKTEKRKEEPDLITEAAPVDDAAAVASRVLNLVPQIIEPGVSGVEAEPIFVSGQKAGFVKVWVPRNQGPPHRSRKDWKFYQRIASSALPMDYWQIEERFSLRANPRLELYLEERSFSYMGTIPGYCRKFLLGLKNTGLGIARFPALRFKCNSGLRIDDSGLDGNSGFGLPRRAAEPGTLQFQGGVDHVVFPGDILPISMLLQGAIPLNALERHQSFELHITGQDTPRTFPAINFDYQIICEGAPLISDRKIIPETQTNVPYGQN